MVANSNEQTGAQYDSPPKWFWVASSLGLVWNLMGVAAFVSQMTTDPNSLPAAERTFYEATPVWATLAFAVAVFGGVLGCIALLLRRSWAFALLALSLLGVIVQVSHSLLLGNGIEVFGAAAIALPALTLGIGAALLVFTRHATQRGWLG